MTASPAARPPLVNFIGIGAQKCASTWINRVLAEHPQVCHSRPKELDYFSYFYGKGHDWYESHFPAGTSARRFGDSSPSYFVHPLAPERAARYNPALKIVLALRDPVERAYSNHLHMVREGFIAGPDNSFEYGLSRNEMYLEQSRYAKHLRRWLEAFPAEQLFVVFQEHLASRAAPLARDIYRFLGVDETFEPGTAATRANESRVARHPRLEAVMRSAAGGLRSVGLGRALAAVKSHPVVAGWRQGAQVDLRDIVPPMRDETRRRLVEELAPEVEALRRLLGLDALPWPAFDAGAVR